MDWTTGMVEWWNSGLDSYAHNNKERTMFSYPSCDYFNPHNSDGTEGSTTQENPVRDFTSLAF